MVINSTIFNTHHKTSLLSPKLLLEVVQESELDGLNFPTALAKLEPTPPSHSRMSCPTPSSPPARVRELELMIQTPNIPQTRPCHTTFQQMLPLETNLPVSKLTLSHHRSTMLSSKPPTTLSWILSITLLNKRTDNLTQLMDLPDHTVFSSSTPPAVAEDLALNTTDGSNSQLASVSKTRSTFPRTLVTLLLPPAKRTQPILQTQKLTKPKLLLIALPQKPSEIKKSHIDRGKKSLLKLKSNIIQKRKGSPYPFSL